MKAAIVTGFGSVEDHVFVVDDQPKPTLSADDSNHMIVKVLACALAPGDARLLSGKTAFAQLPQTGLPYVLGSDTCGIVVELPKQNKQQKATFHLGDVVVSRFDGVHPVEGCAEYRKVEVQLSACAPQTLTPMQACGLPATALTAKRLVQQYVRPGQRVLILGGCGAVGSLACQYAKRVAGAAYVAITTSQSKEFVVGQVGPDIVDDVIDYHSQKWWQIPEYQRQPFDVVLDFVSGPENWWVGGRSGLALPARTGVYVTLMPGVQTEVTVQGWLDLIRMGFWFVGLLLWEGVVHRWTYPKHVFPNPLENVEPTDLEDLFADFDSGRIHPVLDPASPFSFTQEGVRAALNLQQSKHAHGKVVIQVSNKQQQD